jgi:hypothetical protein
MFVDTDGLTLLRPEKPGVGSTRVCVNVGGVAGVKSAGSFGPTGRSSTGGLSGAAAGAEAGGGVGTGMGADGVGSAVGVAASSGSTGGKFAGAGLNGTTGGRLPGAPGVGPAANVGFATASPVRAAAKRNDRYITWAPLGSTGSFVRKYRPRAW